MKKKYLFGLITCTILLLSSLCKAEYDQKFKNVIRKPMMEACIKAGHPDNSIPLSLVVKSCQCSIDKLLEKYSVEELMEANNYGENYVNFIEDAERFGKECAIEILIK